MQIRDLVFDLGGVLVDWDPAFLYRDYLGMAAPTVDDFLANVCTPSWHDQLDRGLGFAEGTEVLAAQHPAMAAYIRQWDSHWGQMFNGPRGDVDGLLAELATQGYRLHALSNYPSEKLDFLYSNFSFMRRFHSVTISGLLGVAKPDPTIFAHLGALLAGRPAAFFDDRIENIEAAAAAGLSAHHCPSGCDLAALVAQATGTPPS